MEKLEALISIYIINFVLSGVFTCLLLWIGIKIANVERPAFKKIIFISFFTSFIVHLITDIFSIIPNFNAIVGFLIGLILSLFVLKLAFHTELNKAILLWILNIMAQLFAVIVGAHMLIGGISEFIKIM